MSERVLGVFAGGDTPENLIRIWADSCDYLIAADGAANRLLAMGYRPDVIGDMDSFDRSLPGAAELRLIDRPEQDATDCDKLLAHCVELGHEAITLVGVEGDRLDHVLSTVFSALRSPLNVALALRSGMAFLVRGGESQVFETKIGRTVSFFPLRATETVFLKGVEWELEDASLAPDGLVSISNRANSSSVSVQIGTGAALLFVQTPFEEMPIW